MTRDPKLVEPRFRRRHPDWFAVSWELLIAVQQLKHVLRKEFRPPLLRLIRVIARFVP